MSAVENCEQAMRRPKADNIDLLIVGYTFDEMQSSRLSKEVRGRNDLELRRVRLVALGGHDSGRDKAQSGASGFDAHLAKPPALDDIRAQVARVDSDPGRPSSSLH